MAGWLDKKSAVVADTVYCDGKLVARDVSFTLPAITFMTADVQAMGTLSFPIYGLIEDMEAAITKIGLDLGLAKLLRLGKKVLEFRWVQTRVKADGSTGPEGCKAFLTVAPKSLGEISPEIGSPTEIESTYAVMREQIYVDGKELLLVDRLARKLRVDGVDLAGSLESLI